MMEKNLCKPREHCPNPDAPAHFAVACNSRLSGCRPGLSFCNSYIRQLWGIYLSYSFGLKLTLRQHNLESAKNSQKFVEILAALCSELDRLDIVRLEYEGFDSLCQLKGSILAANHPSALDAIALINKVPNLTCVMRASLRRNPFMQGAAQMLGCIPNDAGASFIHQAEKKLRLGENLLIFPEGTRTAPGRAVNPFKKGFALIAVRNQFPVHTVLIEREQLYLAKGGSVLAPVQLPIKVRLKVGKVFKPRASEQPRELATRIQEYFGGALRLSGTTIQVNEEARL